MTAFSELHKKLIELADLRGALSLMAWDQEVYLPAGAAALRAQQTATLGGIHHEILLKDVGPLLQKVSDEHSLSEFERLNLKEIQREYDKATRLPTEFIRRLYQLSSEAQTTWVEARKKSDFSMFSGVLEKMVQLKIEEADYLGFEDDPYDALLDRYEPEGRSKEIRVLFEGFKLELESVMPQLAAAKQVDDSFLKSYISQEKQLEFGQSLARDLGYDLQKGRIDLSSHPFSIPFGMEDVRITTSVDPMDLSKMLFSTIHEAGHAMYEQGFTPAHYGLPAAEPSSISIHESQSRLYENNLARSLPFWQHYFPVLSRLFPDKLKNQGPESIFKAVNKVQPSLIRILSDELTYHFHIILRFEIENDLINQRVKVKELPELWNHKMKQYLDQTVPDDAHGVLQDIHWSHGSFGYFPTYSLGSFYAAQFMATAKKSLPDLDKNVSEGDFSPLLDWLRTHIHAEGKLYNSRDLCIKATGEPLNVDYFIHYIKDKLSRVYGLSLI